MPGLQINKCFCCCDLRLGVIGFGVAWAVVSVILAIMCGLLANVLYYAIEDPKPNMPDIFALKITFGVTIFVGVIWALNSFTSILMVIGASAKKRSLLVPWIIVACITTGIYLYILFITIQNMISDAVFYDQVFGFSNLGLAISYAIIVSLMLYFLMCVANLFRLSSAEHAECA